MGKKVRLKPIANEPEVQLAERSSSMPAGHLGEPVVDRRRRWRRPCRRTARSGSGRRRSRCPCTCQSKGTTASMTPVRPPIGEQGDEADGEEHRRREAQRAAPHRRQPVEDLDAGRHRDQHAGAGEEGVEQAGLRPTANMWCAQTPKPRKPIATDADDHERVAEERLAREDRHDLGHDAEGRQDEDVDLGVAEEPEEVLPEQRVAAAGAGRRSACRDWRSKQQHHVRRGERRGWRTGSGTQLTQHQPDEERHLRARHAGARMLQDGDDEVDRADGCCRGR